jgi:acetolactate synthase-1/2/3 large subunit
MPRTHIGMDLYGPDPDFAGLAKSMGWYSEGPFENGDDLKPALKRAIEQVNQGKPALIDVVCDRRNHG